MKVPELSKERQAFVTSAKRLIGQCEAVDKGLRYEMSYADLILLLSAIRGGVISMMSELLKEHIRTQTDLSPEELSKGLTSLLRGFFK